MNKSARNLNNHLDRLLLIATFLVMLVLTVVSFTFRLKELMHTENPYLVGEVGKLVSILLAEILLALGLLTLYAFHNSQRHSKAISAANSRYSALISNIQGGVQVSGYNENFGQMRTEYISEGFTELTGYTLEDMKAMENGQRPSCIYQSDQVALSQELPRLIHNNAKYSVEYRVITKNGQIIWLLDRGKVIETEDGSRQLQSVLTDISLIKEQQEQLRISEERFRVAIEGTDNLVFEYDCQNNCYVAFANSERILGKTKDEINADLAYTKPLSEQERIAALTRYFYHKDDFEKIMAENIQSVKTGKMSFEARLRTGDGRYIWCKVSRTILRDKDGLPRQVLGYLGNIDTLKRQSELFRIRSEKDALTGFYNKGAAVSLIDDALQNDSGTPHTLFVMDIDNFKTINDTMGHMVGDRVIAETAERIRSIFRSGDILGRVGGDEFVVLISGMADTQRISKKAQEIIQAFRVLSVNGERFCGSSISIGIEMCMGEACDYVSTFIKADKALYEAKRTGKNRYVFYSERYSRGDCHTYHRVDCE